MNTKRDMAAMIRVLRAQLTAVTAERDEARRKLSVEEEAHAQLQVLCFEGQPTFCSIFGERDSLKERIAELEAKCAAMETWLNWFYDRRASFQSKFDLHGPQDTADAMREVFAAIAREKERG